MSFRGVLFAAIQLMLIQVSLTARQPDSLMLVTGIVYNPAFQPLPASHVINLSTREGDITDSLGMFQLHAYPADTLLILNISYKDTMVTAARIRAQPQIRLQDRYYVLEEASSFFIRILTGRQSQPEKSTGWRKTRRRGTGFHGSSARKISIPLRA